ncbi:alpha/beta hydrolase family domain-containing protein [Ditylenchus destructor]|uniref:Protein phosphatase methylesterase 1 n=1 Tax=Ditylenchus destructor TaxID=166010 RepID=A0AAD4N5E4_9BILA|nr:alpha/beta hydrolase family domain-containing protein [Ditylenchus destructor]
MHATDFGLQKQIVNVGDDPFTVYLKGSEGPVFLLLHGGGYTGLTWACFAEEICAKIDCQIVAPDLRGHGETTTNDELDLSADRQVQDIVEIYQALYGNRPTPPPLICVGHSMGGALAVRLVNSQSLPNVIALGVIDVVEGSAMSALSAMPAIIRNRPANFSSLEHAVRWSVESGMTRNVRAARISMPSQLCKDAFGNGYVWRINLGKTQPHWDGWFRGLSQTFLDCSSKQSIHSILILANVDRLDKTLLTGQMRGMFQSEVLPKVGHAVHEDSPEQVAEIFIKFVNRYKVFFNKTKPPT